jgi:hypothetical protein
VAATGLRDAVTAVADLTPRLHDTLHQARRLLDDLEPSSRRPPQRSRRSSPHPPCRTSSTTLPRSPRLRAAADDPRTREIATLLIGLEAASTTRRLAAGGRLLDGADALRDGLATAGNLFERLTSEFANRRRRRVGEFLDRLDMDSVVRRSATAGPR